MGGLDTPPRSPREEVAVSFTASGEQSSHPAAASALVVRGSGRHLEVGMTAAILKSLSPSCTINSGQSEQTAYGGKFKCLQSSPQF